MKLLSRIRRSDPPSSTKQETKRTTVESSSNVETAALPRPDETALEAVLRAETGVRRDWSARIIALGILIALLYYGQLFFITLIAAIIIAFILEPFVLLVMKLRLPRAAASFVACSIALLGLYLVGLGAFSQVAELVEDLPSYSDRINQLFETTAQRAEGFEKGLTQLLPKRFREAPPIPVNQQPPPSVARRRRPTDPLPVPQAAAPPSNTPPPVQEVRIQQPRTSLLVFLYNSISSAYNPLLMISFVPFLVYFMLAWRDHMRRGFVGLFSSSNRDVAMKTWHAVADMARAYMAGNFLLGLVLSLFSTLFFMLVHLPYPLLIGPISGFLSLVPYVGLPLALAPPILAALAVYDNPGAYLIISSTVGFLHLIGLNLFYPKMVGGRVHLNPLAVTVALMFWGLLWGGAGLVLAIPITAGLKAVCDNVASLKGYGKLLGD